MFLRYSGTPKNSAGSFSRFDIVVGIASAVFYGILLRFNKVGLCCCFHEASLAFHEIDNLVKS